MRNYFRIITGLLIFTVLATNVCFAAALDDYSINDTTKELVVMGTPDGAEENDYITIQILRTGKTAEDVDAFYTDPLKMAGDFVLFTQVAADENGGYTESISLDGEDPGFYEVRVNGAYAGDIYFCTNEHKEDILEAIKENCDPEAEAASVAYLKTNFVLHTPEGAANVKSIWINSFNVNSPLVYTVTEDGLFKVFNLMVDELTVDNVRDKMALAANIAAINEDKVDFETTAQLFALDEGYFAAYTEKLPAETKASFVKNHFKGKGYLTVAEIQPAFNDAVLLEMCNALVGWADVEDFIIEFGEDAGVNMDIYDSSEMTPLKKSKLYTYVLNKGGFTSIQAFSTYVNNIMEELVNEADRIPGSSSPIGGGGGGGGGGTAGGTTISKPVVPTEKVEEPEATPDKTKSSFTDMAGYDWAVESVEALKEAGIVTGTGEDKYEPGREVSREEMLVMILRAFEVEIGENASDFSDAAKDGWYTSYLAAAKEKGFVSGKPDGTFGVGEAVTREDAAVMAYNIAKAMGIEFDINKKEAFKDDAEVSDYAKDGVYALKNAEVINGKGEGKFDPKATCTRAEAAKIIFTLISK